jgi:CBS domain-containing protein
MKVKEVMHNVNRISHDKSVKEVAEFMEDNSIGSVLVERDDKIIGILTERDILHKVVAKGENSDVIRANDIINYPLITIDSNEHILEASRIMDEKRIRRLLVTENGKIVGKVTANSISRNLKYLMVKEPKTYIRNEY